MSGIYVPAPRPNRAGRRRAVAYAVIVGALVALVVVSSTPPVKELQRGLAFALAPFAEGVKLDRLDGPPGVGSRVHMRDLDTHHAPVHQAQDRLRAVRPGSANRRETRQLGGHRHQLQALGCYRAVLAVKEHPVESQPAHHLHHLR